MAVAWRWGSCSRDAAAQAACLLARQTADGRPLIPLLPRHNGPGASSGAQCGRGPRTCSGTAGSRQARLLLPQSPCAPGRAACPWAAPARPQPVDCGAPPQDPGVRRTSAHRRPLFAAAGPGLQHPCSEASLSPARPVSTASPAPRPRARPPPRPRPRPQQPARTHLSAPCPASSPAGRAPHTARAAPRRRPSPSMSSLPGPAPASGRPGARAGRGRPAVRPSPPSAVRADPARGAPGRAAPLCAPAAPHAAPAAPVRGRPAGMPLCLSERTRRAGAPGFRRHLRGPRPAPPSARPSVQPSPSEQPNRAAQPSPDEQPSSFECRRARAEPERAPPAAATVTSGACSCQSQPWPNQRRPPGPPRQSPRARWAAGPGKARLGCRWGGGEVEATPGPGAFRLCSRCWGSCH